MIIIRANDNVDSKLSLDRLELISVTIVSLRKEREKKSFRIP